LNPKRTRKGSKKRACLLTAFVERLRKAYLALTIRLHRIVIHSMLNYGKNPALRHPTGVLYLDEYFFYQIKGVTSRN